MKSIQALANEIGKNSSHLMRVIKSGKFPIKIFELGPHGKTFVSDEDAEFVKKHYEQATV